MQYGFRNVLNQLSEGHHVTQLETRFLAWVQQSTTLGQGHTPSHTYMHMWLAMLMGWYVN